ncbi:hypothetical protein M405DRAFT_864285 [Rhizopogon salebrosus TDB-379]|nr:hypothetical protein M405DRAFT_864285 [Rhizopogon salebrosus TDB-379]
MSSTVAPAPTPTDTHSDSSSPPSTAGANHVHNFILFAAAAVLIGACIISLERTWRSMMIISALRLPEPRLQRDGRRGRRKLVPPVLYETWLSPLTVTSTGKGAVGTSWRSIQPVSASLVRTRQSQTPRNSVTAVGLSDSETPSACPLPNNSQPSSAEPPARSTSRPRFALPPVCPFNVSGSSRGSAAPGVSGGENVRIENFPEAVKIAVMICMPYPAHPYRNDGDEPSCHPGIPDSDDAPREYQIGVTQVPWT